MKQTADKGKSQGSGAKTQSTSKSSDVELQITGAQMKLAKKLGMASFAVELKSEMWNLSKVMTYLNQLQDGFKCQNTEECKDIVCYLSDLDGSFLCDKHYKESIANDVSLKLNFRSVSFDFDETKKNARKFEVIFIQIKTATAFLKLNKLKLVDMKKIISNIEEDEKKLDLNVSKIMESTVGSKTAEKYIILVKVLEELDKASSLAEGMMNQCKLSSLSTVFVELFSQINKLWTSNSEKIFELDSSKIDHPILNKKIKICEVDTKAKNSLKEESKIVKSSGKEASKTAGKTGDAKLGADRAVKTSGLQKGTKIATKEPSGVPSKAYSHIPAKPGVYEFYKHQLLKDTKDYNNKIIKDGKKLSLKRALKVLEFYQNLERNIQELAIRHRDKLSMEEFQAIHLKYKSYELEPEGSEEDTIFMYMKEDDEKEMIEVLSEVCIPDTKAIAIYECSLIDTQTLNNFLNKSIPDNLKSLLISDSSTSHIELSPYFPSLLSATRSLSYFLELHKFIITQSEFESLIAACKHLEGFGLYSCLIQAESVCNFSAVESSRIEQIWLSFCGYNNTEDWDQHQDNLKNILIGIKKCAPLMKSLKQINFGYMVGLLKETVTTIFNEVNLGEIKLCQS